MAKKAIEAYLKLQVKGGGANPSSVGPALGSKGLNIMEFCKQFNGRTQDKAGDTLPVLITIYKDKSFDFVIKTPPVSVLIAKKSNIQKGSSESNRKKVGALTWEEIKDIATVKMKDLNAFSISSAMKMVAGTARSMGVEVQGEVLEGNKI